MRSPVSLILRQMINYQYSCVKRIALTVVGDVTCQLSQRYLG